MPFNAKKDSKYLPTLPFSSFVQNSSQGRRLFLLLFLCKAASLIHFIVTFFVVAFPLAVLFMRKRKKKSSFSQISVLQRHSFAFSGPNLKPFWNNNVSPCNSAPLTVWTSYKGPHSFLLKYQSFWVEVRWCKSELEPVHCPRNVTRDIYVTSQKRFSLFYVSL